MTRFRFDTKEEICWKALNEEMSLPEAADALIHSDPFMQDPFSYVYPEAEILEEMLSELWKHPREREAIENKYREVAMNAFNNLLDIFTTPDVPCQEMKQYPIPRSSPRNRD